MPEDDDWVITDFVEVIGEHQNRYARERYNLLVHAKMIDRPQRLKYDLSKAQVNTLFSTLAAETVLWEMGKSINLQVGISILTIPRSIVG